MGVAARAGLDHLSFADTPGISAGLVLANRGTLCGPFGFSLTPTSRHDLSTVARHRQLLAQTIGCPPERLVPQRQVHGTEVSYGEHPGAGAPGPVPARWRALRHPFAGESDLLVTERRGHALLLSVADCCPLILWSPVGRAVAAAHCGWRGCAAGAVKSAVEAMEGEFGVRAAGLRAWVGPCAGFDSRSYEVGTEVYRALSGYGGCFTRSERSGHYYLNLGRLVVAALESVGVPTGSIETVALDTIGDRRFHSYRRDGADSGRMAAWVMLR
ncbi:MAG: polyphenol oxidase family protein [Alkalispirochaetaceae bacterium]